MDSIQFKSKCSNWHCKCVYCMWLSLCLVFNEKVLKLTNLCHTFFCILAVFMEIGNNSETAGSNHTWGPVLP